MPKKTKEELKEPKAPEGSILTEEKKEITEVPTFDDTQQKYITALRKRLEDAKTTRDQNHEEWDNISYLQAWYAEERAANTLINAISNKGETRFQSGTLRSKMFQFLNNYQSLNLGSDIEAFDSKQLPINMLGTALSDIIYKTKELEGDEEWRSIRQYEMMKHGYVFVEDLWEDRWEVRKKVTQGRYGSMNIKIETNMKKAPGAPRRVLIPGPAVYLGSMKKYMITDQPFVFTYDVISYEEAEKKYGAWDMWKYVTTKKKQFSGQVDQYMVDSAWRLNTYTDEDQVEEIKYQDKPNNEFQILLNGVPMLPMDYPLSEISQDGEYTLIQQNLEPIRHNFAYGKSFIFKNKNMVAVMDQMMKFAVLKTHKSYFPPRANLSKRVVSANMFMPGVVTKGVKPGEVPPMDANDSQGVTASELAMIDKIRNFFNENTTAPSFQQLASEGKGGQPNIPQVQAMQQEAERSMALLTFAATQLEKKLDAKRLVILLKKWFDPIDRDVDSARKVIENRYRQISRMTQIPGKGQGMRMVIPTDRVLTEEMIAQTQESMSLEMSMPVEIIVVSPEAIRQAVGLTWEVICRAKEKKTSNFNKIMFDAMIASARNLGLQPNPQYMAERFVETWDESPKLFAAPEIPPGMPGMPPGAAPGAPTAPNAPTPAARTVARGMRPPAPVNA